MVTTGPTEVAAKPKPRRRSSGSKLFAHDRRLGVRWVAGADEAGRGCLAGPLVAAAVLFDLEAITPRAVRPERLQAAHAGGARGAVPARAAAGREGARRLPLRARDRRARPASHEPGRAARCAARR